MFFPGTFNIFVPGDSVFMLLKCMCNNILIKKVSLVWNRCITRNPIFVLRTSPFRSSHQKYSTKKGVLKKFTKLAEKHLYQNFIFNKNAGLSHATLLKKAQVFPCEFCEIFKKAYLKERLLMASFTLLIFSK